MLDNPRVDVLGEGPNREVFTEHTVTLQLRYVDRAQDQPKDGVDPPHIRKMLNSGWYRVRVAGSGRKAMERMICLNCINANDLFEVGIHTRPARIVPDPIPIAGIFAI